MFAKLRFLWQVVVHIMKNWRSFSPDFELVRTFSDVEIWRSENGVTYLLHLSHDDRWVVIDPTLFAAWRLSMPEWRVKRVRGVLITHPHLDHTSGVKAVAKMYDCPVYFHKAQKQALRRASEIGDCWRIARWWLKPLVPFFWLVFRGLFGIRAGVVIGEDIEVKALCLELKLLAGHSSGDLVFRDPAGRFVLAGDLFLVNTEEGLTYGRVDLVGGDAGEWIFSMLELAGEPDAECLILPAHVDHTTVKLLRRALLEFLKREERMAATRPDEKEDERG